MALTESPSVATGDGAAPIGQLPAPWQSTGDRRWWRVSCRDSVNRRQFLTVLVDRDRVLLVGPPGETAVLSAGQVGQLKTALREAADQAGR